MPEKNEVKQEKKKGFFSRLMEKLDKKMEVKAQQSSCCGVGKKNGSSCC
ncbi:MAG: hypothetical protein NUV91_05760 [Candidatus Omnitrophica bacterium]|nr:hypothetical protein [Candidatus Omnitrophota bacterium]